MSNALADKMMRNKMMQITVIQHFRGYCILVTKNSPHTILLTDLSSYVTGLLRVEKLIFNLKPVAQKLGLPTETWSQAVSCWQEEKKQLEIILLSWREKHGDKADPALLRKTLVGLEPEGKMSNNDQWGFCTLE